jgi:Dienelactone hydrolase family
VINDAGIPYYIANNGWAADRPFVVLAPQHNNIDSPAYPYPCDVAFGGSCLMQHQHDYGNPLPAGSPCWAPSEVQAFLAYALANYDVDPTRVYLTGLSCGGYGVWESLAQFGAGRIAAAVPIAGDGRPALQSFGCALASAPIWAFHGDADDVVNPAGSIDTIGALQTCPTPPAQDLRLTIYPQVDHNSWDHAYSGSQGQDIYGWMLGFTTG